MFFFVFLFVWLMKIVDGTCGCFVFFLKVGCTFLVMVWHVVKYHFRFHLKSTVVTNYSTFQIHGLTLQETKLVTKEEGIPDDWEGA